MAAQMQPMITRRTVFLSLAAGLAAFRAHAQPAFTPTPQDQADLSRIEAYLNGIKSLTARFMQVAPDGDITEGRVWLERPGRMRFQYDPPTPFLLIAMHGELLFNDSSLKQTSRIPLSRTPLGILLAPKVMLSGDVTVTGMQRQPGQIQVSLVRTASPGEGTLTLVFADNPLALRQWTVIDAQRQETRVTLYNVERGVKLDNALFELPPGLSGGGSTGGGG